MASERRLNVTRPEVEAVTKVLLEPLMQAVWATAADLAVGLLGSEWMAQRDSRLQAEAWDQGWRASMASTYTAPAEGENPYTAAPIAPAQQAADESGEG